VQKITDYRLSLAASQAYIARHGAVGSRDDLTGRRIVSYIPDMIFDKELDYLAEIGIGPATLTSNSVSVQLNWLRTGAGVGVVHDFALPVAPELTRILTDRITLTRAFWLIRHESDARLDRLNRFADQLTREARFEMARLEALIPVESRA
jgi:DNA-binding transcriptional LysR family regulator